jgi:hypothetical protein
MVLSDRPNHRRTPKPLPLSKKSFWTQRKTLDLTVCRAKCLFETALLLADEIIFIGRTATAWRPNRERGPHRANRRLHINHPAVPKSTNKMTFNAKEYAWAIAHGKKTKKSERPVTLADHEAAEREARQLIETRLRDGCAIPEISELEEDREEAVSIQIWGQDLVAEAEGWEEIVVDLLIFKAKQKKAAA